MEVFGGLIGILLLILAIVIAISWILFPIWIYTINKNVKLIVENMKKG